MGVMFRKTDVTEKLLSEVTASLEILRLENEQLREQLSATLESLNLVSEETRALRTQVQLSPLSRMYSSEIIYLVGDIVTDRKSVV